MAGTNPSEFDKPVHSTNSNAALRQAGWTAEDRAGLLDDKPGIALIPLKSLVQGVAASDVDEPFGAI